MKFNQLPAYAELAAKCTRLGVKLVEPKWTRSRIAFVGEALGREENARDEYFVGAAGRLLTKLIGESGLQRDGCYITNVLKVQPPDNKVGRLGELGLTIEDFLPILKEELDEIQPRVVVLLGNLALKSLTENSGITKWRGSEVKSKTHPNIRFFPTLHPSYIQRGQWTLYPFCRSDITIAAQAAFGLEKKARDYQVILDPSLEQVLDYIERCKKSDATVVDIETAHRKIRAVGLAASATEGISIPFRWKGFRNRWSYTDMCIILRALREWYCSPGIKIAHNAEYDFLWLHPLIGWPMEAWFDTMRAHALVYPEAPHDLGFVMSTHTTLPYHKDEGRASETDEQLWTYNIKDCVGTFRVYEKLVEELKEIGMWKFFHGYTMPFLRLTLEMERVGIKVDRDTFNTKKTLITKRAKWLERAITKKVGREVNVNSPKQICELLYDDWKLPPQRHRKTGKRTADRVALEFLYARYPNPVFKMIVVQRHLTAKILGTYLSDKIIGEDGNAHTSFGVTVTGRLSSRESDVFSSGTDLQNQPKKIRDMFVPDEGHVFTSVDLKGADNSIQALVANMKRALECLARGDNMHLKLGEWFYGRVVDKKKEPDIYKRIKNVEHGTNYGMGERTFATYIKKTAKEAKELRAKYLEWVPELEVWHRWVVQQVTTGNRSLTTPMRRKRTFTKPPTDHRLKTEAYAHIPQSTVADIVNIGGLGLWLVLPKECRLVLQIHDEWLLSHPIELSPIVKQLSLAHLQDLREVRWDDRRMVIPVEFESNKETWRG